MRYCLRLLAGELRHRVRLAALGRGSLYEKLSEVYGRTLPDGLAVGAGGFEAVGRMELEILRTEGLEPRATLLDFGCGAGRLAVHAIPYLIGEHYIGVDISRTMLERGSDRVKAMIPAPDCRVTWTHQRAARFVQPDACVDMLCAFSVFTHMEHEDIYVYLKEARRVVRPGGRLIFSCLPLPSDIARQVFLLEAEVGFTLRWRRVRNVTTSVDLMNEIVRMAGWTRLRWYPGDEPIPTLRDRPGPSVFGQAVCVLQP